MPRPHAAEEYAQSPKARDAVALVAIFVGYLLLYRYSNFFHTTDLRATPWNPETGIAVAAGAMLGFRSVPVIILANFLGNLMWASGMGFGWSLVSSAIHGLIYTGTTAVLAPRLRQLQEPTTGLAIRFIIFAAILTIASACTRLLIAHFALQVSATYLVRYITAVAIGNLIGILTMVPLALALPTPVALRDFIRNLTTIDALAFALAAFLSLVVFGWKQLDDFKFFYLLFIPVIILAIRRGLAGAGAAILVLDFSVVATLRWLSFEPSTGLDLQVLMISLSATGLILGAAVSERERISRQLALSHEQLHESQVALQHAARLTLASEMATALAHELNQPLAAARNYVRIVRRKLAKPRPNRIQLERHLDEAVGAVDDAAGLLKASREFLSRGEAGKTSLAVGPLIDSSVDMVRAEMARARIDVEINIESEMPSIWGNRTQLQQVLLNLLRNSKEAILSASNPVRKIEIGARHTRRRGYVVFSVTDTGPGVSVEVREDVFSPLRSSKAGGLGLGLSLSRSIVINHGGEISYEEQSPHGACFLFTIPVVKRGASAT